MSAIDQLAGFSADKALARLQPFQRDAVEHAFHRLFVAEDSTRRFLVADEVGLGKTLIAKGIVAKALEHLRTRVKRVDIVYVCSNASIARQNVQRLSVFDGGQGNWQSADRITLLPLSLRDSDTHRINLVSLTPGTSMAVGTNMGARKERLLLYAMLRDHWNLSGKGPLNAFQGHVARTDHFRDAARHFRRDNPIAGNLEKLFSEEVDRTVAAELAAGKPDLKTRFLKVSDDFSRTRKHVPTEESTERRRLIGELRGVLARSCISALQPDLVILDEFQRFKHLLKPADDAEPSEREAAELAQQLFSWSHESGSCHVLLLSATPYKAYTLAEEELDDNHYEDFLSTVRFLDENPARHQVFRDRLEEYGRRMFELGEAGPDALKACKEAVEGHLRRVMSRTERIPSTQHGDAMLKERLVDDMRLNADELLAYESLNRIAIELGQRDVVEYWKSAPYPLNFMDEYQVKQRLKDRLDDSRGASGLLPLLRRTRPHLLDFAQIDSYQEVPFPNPRLRALMNCITESRAWELLWVPPVVPSHRLDGAFQQAHERGFTKQLLFSAWQVVPKSIATLLSYESERRAFSKDNSGNQPLAGARDRYSTLLRWASVDGRLSGMPVLMLMYPSRALCEIGTAAMADCRRDDRLPTLSEVLAAAAERIRRVLPADMVAATEAQRSDEAWYWAAPLVLDGKRALKDTADWWQRSDLDQIWAGTAHDESEADSAGLWSTHVDQARKFVSDGTWPTGLAPADLVDVLALVAIASPAVTALRALSTVVSSPTEAPAMAHVDAAARIGWAFRSFFNRPESVAIIRAGKDQLPYWRQLLEYSAGGCLTAVMGEYVHILRDACGVFDQPADKACDAIAGEIEEALTLRVTNSAVDSFRFEAEGLPILESKRMRSLFAMRFGSSDPDDANQAQRGDQVRKAFNSPFWPFVLASTAIGQEGLDFHCYCHSVWHWNLPSNPVDMEQREGRVHRFKGHAVRKNVGKTHGAAAPTHSGKDMWANAFALAKEQAPADDRGLVPCWIYAIENGATVERVVPTLPLSRDVAKHQALRRSIGAYRLVFGQPRQEDLLAYLLDRIDPKALEAARSALQINLAPPHFAAGTNNVVNE